MPESIFEPQRLRTDIYRSDIEKLRLFTQMLRTDNLIKRDYSSWIYGREALEKYAGSSGEVVNECEYSALFLYFCPKPQS